MVSANTGPFPAPPRQFGLNRTVFGVSAGIIILAVAAALIMPDAFNAVVGQINSAVVNGIGWYYVALVTGFVVFSLVVAFTKLGTIRLGRDDELPQYKLLPWFSMLFAAGMGIGLVFWGVAEPMWHLADPPPGFADATLEARANRALTQTFLHWGVHAWSVYAVVGLAVAYASHRKGRPISLRWALEPILGKYTDTWVGNVIDIAAIVGTLFGVATSLGFGVNQIAGGLDFLGILDTSVTVKVVIVLVITAMATASVVSGLDRGIKILSNINLILAAVFLLVILALGPTLFILRDLVSGLGGYVQNFISLSFQTFPMHGARGEAWLGSWTTYYWGWWISWSPFVGIFIARISRGRTVREFIVGVLLVPTMVTITWFSVLGGTAIYRELFGEGGIIVDGAVNNDTALFQMLSGLPAGQVLSGVAVVLVTIFFITSTDSGSFVVDMLAHGGDPNPPARTRLFWAVLGGVIAAALLAVGSRAEDDTSGMAALQAMTIIAAAPFSLVMIGMCVASVRALRADHRQYEVAQNEIIRRELLHEATEHTVENTVLVAGTPDDEGEYRLVYDPENLDRPPDVVKVVPAEPGGSAGDAGPATDTASPAPEGFSPDR